MGLGDCQPAIPTVDFAEWTSGGPDRRKQIANDFVAACRTVGFAYIINHGVAPGRVKEAFAMSQKLFDLGHEQKMLAPHPPGGAVHRGYSWPGFEKITQTFGDEADREDLKKRLRSIADVKESYEVGSENNQDQPNIWLPEDVLPGFRSFTTEFYWQMNTIARMLLRAMAIGIGLDDEEFFLSRHSGHNNQLRLLHYPPVPAADIESQRASRMPAHSDWGTLTMLFQDDCGGLEVEKPHKEGEFMSAHPLKDAIVTNVGDLLQRWSNDKLKSTLHRVTLPPQQDRFSGDERMTRARYSIPYFVAPEGPTIVECLPACIDEKHAAKYKAIRWNDYMLMRAGMSYEDQPVESGVPG
ncbi:MAG: hypothetical protein HETSPECPRED_008283 [Heterodermia speciosa]|uniref:Fe2OG dioxygenase domain-containing protein n=1 Tax=Heterodermia speciosa TaxID=116794 RepID=A0A8H3FWS9_9LECA|nr:MAG: hypothetical protein HETSPECPRED_008283 [Heterodermia speciosa]